MDRTPLQHLGDLLTGDLEEFVRTRRSAGMSWRRISLELRDVTDRRVDVTYQTLRNWYPDDANGEAA